MFINKIKSNQTASTLIKPKNRNYFYYISIITFFVLMPAKFLPILITLFFSFFLKAQEHPPIQVYTPNEYRAENKNWAITQSKKKYFYVANNKRLIEYN